MHNKWQKVCQIFTKFYREKDVLVLFTSSCTDDIISKNSLANG